MALSAKLQLRQAQSLVMTPQLLQSIKLLQMTHAELEKLIDEEIERNPLLVRDETADGAMAPPERRNSVTDTSADFEQEASAEPEAMLSELETDSATIAGKLGTSLENVFPDDPGGGDALAPDLQAQWKSAPSGRSDGQGEVSLEAIAAAGVTLNDHVLEQIALTFRDPVDLIIARELTDALDESGYMRGDCQEMADRLGVALERVVQVLERCQGLEPAGLFARDLPECLAIQLRERDRFDPAMKALIENLNLLAKRDFAALSKICAVDQDDLIEMLAEIRALDPKPGTAFTSAAAAEIVPDVTVSAAPDGSWSIELNSEALPRVLVDQQYFSRISRTAPAEDKEFLSNCLQDANWLTRSLDQRARTILKVASEIIRRQDLFLIHGISHLKPLTLKTVADEIGMHESTVSRVTANKYMATPRGVFELRYFFSQAIAASDDGEAHSSSAVRHRIRELIDAEKPDAVLSDDAIVDILKQSNIDIARRTVAKYREAMHIPSSVQRRREKKALAAAGH
ncbi:MAG: RNA polymerase factor sigma-54 [Rhizobiaceae bacterium]